MRVRNVGFLEAAKLGFQNYFRFSGRAQRAEFWWFQLFVVLVCLVLMGLDFGIFGLDEDDPTPISDLWSLATLIPTLSIGWRRMHDIGKSGWWSLLPLLPLIWAVIAGVTLFSSEGDYTMVGVISLGFGLIATLAAFIYIIVLFAKDSDPYDNNYGPSVKYHDIDDGFDQAFS